MTREPSGAAGSDPRSRRSEIEAAPVIPHRGTKAAPGFETGAASEAGHDRTAPHT